MLIELENRIKKILREKFPESQGIQSLSISLPPPHIKGNYSIAWPMSAAKHLKKSPLEIAGEAALLIKDDSISDCEAVPPGFVNFTVKDEFCFREILSLNEKQQKYFCLSPFTGAVNLEFVSANPTGPLHLASGRAAAIGDSLARILEFVGCKVSREYYVNDAGRQVEILGLSLKARFEGKEPPENGYRGEYLLKMAKNLPRKDCSRWGNKDFSEFAISKIIKMHKTDLAAFGVEFDNWFLESELHKKSWLKKTLEKIKRKKLIYEKDGALWFGSGAKGRGDKDRVLVKSDGRNTYFLSDIAYHLNKSSRGFKHIIDIWGADHHGYVPRMKAALGALIPEIDFRIIIHQLVLLKKESEKVKMSKREGRFISLKELVEEVGKDAGRFFFVMRSPNSHLNFDIGLARKKSNENPVYYVQYVHARICSIFSKARLDGAKMVRPAEVELSDEEKRLAVKVLWFEKILQTCIEDLSPHHLTSYLVELAGLFHSFYDTCRVLDPQNPEKTYIRMKLIEGVRFAIKSGLGLLGVSAPEKM